MEPSSSVDRRVAAQSAPKPMKLRVHTMAGSTYLIDGVAMTWKRFNVNVGHEDIPGLGDINGGRLDQFPYIRIGESMGFNTDKTWIRTTPVVLIEDVT